LSFSNLILLIEIGGKPKPYICLLPKHHDNSLSGCGHALDLTNYLVVNTFRAAWFWQFLQKKTAVFGCLTNALAPPPIAL